MNCLNYTSAMSQPFGSLIAANLAQAWCLGWKWSLWPELTWLAVQRSIAVFFFTLFDNINDVTKLRPVCITPLWWYSHFCCWFLTNWTSPNFWEGNSAYGLWRLGLWYNIEKLVFSGLILYYQWYETLLNCINYTSAVTQPFLLLIAANLGVAGCLG